MERKNGLKVTQGQDKLVNCPCCKSNACYESEFQTQDGPIKTWLCMTCGMTTNTTMVAESEVVKQAEELTADLIKDNKQIHNGLVWYLTVITLPEKGMVFPEPQKFGSLTKDLKTGKKTESEFWDYGWSVVKAIDIPEEEQSKYPDPNNPGTLNNLGILKKQNNDYKKSIEYKKGGKTPEYHWFVLDVENDTNQNKPKLQLGRNARS